MQWEGRRVSTNVEDRRGVGGGLSGRGGCTLGGGIGTIILVLAFWLFGGNPLQLLGILEGTQSPSSGYVQNYEPSAQEDSLAQFVAVVLADTEEVWSDIFSQMGQTYRKPTLVLFTGYTTSACGTAQRATGPFYCSEDERIYVDLSFFHEMETRFRAGGDFAYAYVIAHEVGHHVQKLLGTLDQVHTLMARSGQRSANDLSVRLELQADFYAGVWANQTERLFQSLDPGDIEEALNAATAIGDDRLQEEAQGYSVPDSFTHGTSQQRHDWFYKGYRTGDISQGNTFE
ncbi:MAG: neutral zinc metallopeptidase [Tannerellaceae bacterium]|nr:neutral zinc metallopeptidase [Tannerellaceae bacterium]